MYDHRVDLYALGVILFELLTLERPFRGDNEVATLYRVLNGDIAHRAALVARNPELAAIVLVLMSRDPHSRLADATSVREALLPFRDEARAREMLAAAVEEAAADSAPVVQEPPAEPPADDPTYVDRPRASSR